jgi:Family of unknown function (DUF6263)
MRFRLWIGVTIMAFSALTSLPQGHGAETHKKDAGSIQPAKAGDFVILKWMFEKEKPIFQEVTTLTKQTMTVMGQRIAQNQTLVFIVSWTPREQDRNKNWLIVHRLEAIKCDIEIAGNEITYDSSNRGRGKLDPLGDYFAPLVGSELKFMLSPEYKIIKIDGTEENLRTNALLKQLWGKGELEQMAETMFATVPTVALQKGASWQRTGQTYSTTNKYTYEGKEGKFDKIKVEGLGETTGPALNKLPALPLTNVAIKNAPGTILFDPDKHRIVSTEWKTTLEGKLKVDINGISSDVEMNQEQTTKVKISDRYPGKK